jgi:uncharacterized membrane protein
MSFIASLPMHPLLVHIPVVLVPLAVIGALLILVHPAWMKPYGFIVVALAGAGFLGAMLAASTGEDLQETLESSGQTISATLRDHVEMGDGVQAFAGVFFLVTAAWVGFAWWRRRVGEEKATATVKQPKLLNIILSVLVVLGGVAATWSVTAAGHSGATSVWEKTKP